MQTAKLQRTEKLVFQIALEQIADLPQAEFDTAIKLILHMGQEDLSTAWPAAVVDIRAKKQPRAADD
jgi:hypothetical protein